MFCAKVNMLNAMRSKSSTPNVRNPIDFRLVGTFSNTSRIAILYEHKAHRTGTTEIAFETQAPTTSVQMKSKTLRVHVPK